MSLIKIKSKGEKKLSLRGEKRSEESNSTDNHYVNIQGHVPIQKRCLFITVIQWRNDKQYHSLLINAVFSRVRDWKVFCRAGNFLIIQEWRSTQEKDLL